MVGMVPWLGIPGRWLVLFPGWVYLEYGWYGSLAGWANVDENVSSTADRTSKGLEQLLYCQHITYIRRLTNCLHTL